MESKGREKIANPLKISFIILMVMFVSFGLLSLYGICFLSRLPRTVYDYPLVTVLCLVVVGIALLLVIAVTRRRTAEKDDQGIQDVTELKNEEEQLRQAQKMETIGTLAGGIAHDFNNILGIILGNYELAVEDLPRDHPARLNLEEIMKASVRAKEVVSRLLSFSRDEEFEKKPMPLDSVVNDSLVLLRAFVPASIEIKQTLLTDSGIIMADVSQIHQVLINLCINAVHAMEDCGGVLEIVISTVDPVDEPGFQGHGLGPGRHVKLIVKDSGHGIDPYFTTRSVGKGSGMGLSVVHGIVGNHGGVISIKNNFQSGTVVEVFFPQVDGDPPRDGKGAGPV